jgi:hypothetical protein
MLRPISAYKEETLKMNVFNDESKDNFRAPDTYRNGVSLDRPHVSTEPIGEALASEEARQFVKS